jgi:hypothetical protein
MYPPEIVKLVETHGKIAYPSINGVFDGMVKPCAMAMDSGAPPASHAKQAAASAYMVIRGNHPVDTSLKPTYIGK